MRTVKTTTYENSVDISFGRGSVIYSVPVTVKAGTSLKAGTPIAGDGGTIALKTATVVIKANGATAEGVLLHDVDATNGQTAGTMVIMGILDKVKVETSIGEAIDAAVAIPMVQFRKN